MLHTWLGEQARAHGACKVQQGVACVQGLQAWVRRLDLILSATGGHLKSVKQGYNVNNFM